MRKKNKNIYIILIILLLLGVTFGYAALNSTLNISGKSTIQKNTWDVYFDNLVVKEGSITPTVEPTISNNTTISNFEITLDKPGDYYVFTVDVVNDGSIDAMISSITKTPDLTTTQQKYLNYTIEYQNGEQIALKQLVKANEFVRLKVRVEYKEDLTASELPSEDETLNLGFNVNYVQSDGTGSSVTDNGVYFLDTIEPQGNVGTNGSVVYYYLDETTATLHIWGEGDMTNFVSVKATPWYIAIELIERIKIYEGITSIGTYAFSGATSVTEFIFEGTMEQWNVIKKGTNWGRGLGTSKVICSDGEVSLT